MFSKKLFRLLHKIALFAIIFASIAPSISHALMAQNGSSSSFLQEICTSNGSKVVIQVSTTQGKQLATEFAINKQQAEPKNIAMHLEHCPFCGGGAAVATMPSNTLAIIAMLETKAKKVAQYAAPVFVSYTHVLPPAQAPPSL